MNISATFASLRFFSYTLKVYIHYNEFKACFWRALTDFHRHQQIERTPYSNRCKHHIIDHIRFGPKIRCLKGLQDILKLKNNALNANYDITKKRSSVFTSIVRWQTHWSLFKNYRLSSPTDSLTSEIIVFYVEFLISTSSFYANLPYAILRIQSLTQ